MDRKISRAARHPLIYIVIALFALAGCKQNNWIDWKTQNEIWLQANKSKPGVKCTDSGLQYTEQHQHRGVRLYPQTHQRLRD